MWRLLPPTLLARDGAHYLSLLSCAVHMLKNIHQLPAQSLLLSSMSPSPLLSVTVPDDQTDSLVQWTVPTRPEMTVRDVTRYLQGSLRCHGDSALFSCQGETGKSGLLWDTDVICVFLETVLRDDLKIHNLFEECANRSVVLVFKRRGMKIILPGPTHSK